MEKDTELKKLTSFHYKKSLEEAYGSVNALIQNKEISHSYSFELAKGLNFLLSAVELVHQRMEHLNSCNWSLQSHKDIEKNKKYDEQLISLSCALKPLIEKNKQHPDDQVCLVGHTLELGLSNLVELDNKIQKAPTKFDLSYQKTWDWINSSKVLPGQELKMWMLVAQAVNVEFVTNNMAQPENNKQEKLDKKFDFMGMSSRESKQEEVYKLCLEATKSWADNLGKEGGVKSLLSGNVGLLLKLMEGLDKMSQGNFNHYQNTLKYSEDFIAVNRDNCNEPLNESAIASNTLFMGLRLVSEFENKIKGNPEQFNSKLMIVEEWVQSPEKTPSPNVNELIKLAKSATGLVCVTLRALHQKIYPLENMKTLFNTPEYNKPKIK